ncbi:CAP domain-containing protein [Pseudomonas sp. AR5]|nr:CAP domain-containing protein [Pseudomonas sp. AR5]
MRVFWVLVLLAGWISQAGADEAKQLIESINLYRSEPQRCGERSSEELPPLSEDTRLSLPVEAPGDLQELLGRAGYPMVNVQAISLSGPRDAQSAMRALRESFCKVLLDPQFVDIGVSRLQRDWRITLARPLLDGHLGDSAAEGRKMLELLNQARSSARQCGDQHFAPASALAWNGSLAEAAGGHSRAMANDNFFSHLGQDGRTPGDRAVLAGYEGRQVGENIAAGQGDARKVVDGWLASPGHCANLMNPQFRDFGGAYAVDPQSDANIYWTGLFGAP